MLSQLLSNRVEKTPATEVSADRYQFLALSEAEPDLGVPSGNGYLLTSTTAGVRSWIDPATSLTAPGTNTQVIFNNSGVLAGATGLVYDTDTGRVGIGVTSPTSRLDIAETWNNAGTAFTLIKANITDTASASTSLIADFQVSSSTKVYIDKTGLINATGFLIGATTPGAVTGAHGFTRNGNNLYVYTNGTLRYNFSTSSFNTSLPIGFGTSLTSPDTFVLREAANTIAQRNTTNAQTLRIYNTFTDASNYERATIGWSSNVLEIGTQAAGTGTVRNISIIGGNVGIGQTSPSAKLDVVGDIEVNSNVNLNSEATTLATTTKTQVASFTASSFRSGKLIVQAYDTFTNEVQVSELLVAHNGTTASATEYSVVYTGANPLVVYDVDISSGNVRLLAQRTTPNPTQYTVSETLLSAFDPAVGAFSWDSNTASPGPA